ncbi:hypothetical protein EPD60_16175 [Flaviaesturariibacter flavus]|uniref:Outer membrane protein beta-barrel domain-containing protein n=1 Tax=Flaviaesturariibacter flavus TaxID=2502780 RepID=A0A4R1B220_9BACT|nr:outer membrane beta-barrel protein [Flaviaesturariibacter flavus]TCJ12092.1 hypothetical protein EPD60_16175 [Flaviaesturariibacter flavus]
MKKTIVAALGFAAILGTSSAHAQKGFSLGVTAVPQFSFLQNKNDNDNSSINRKATFDAAFGISGGYNFSDRYGIGLDLLYGLQGQKYESGNNTAFQKVNYVKIPVYFAYTAAPASAISFTAKVGPQLGILTGSKVTDGNGNDIISDTKGAFENTTFGAAAAAGVRFRLSKSLSLNTLARFDHDFTNAESDSYPGYNSSRAKTYNMTTGLEVGLKYAF